MHITFLILHLSILTIIIDVILLNLNRCLLFFLWSANGGGCLGGICSAGGGRWETSMGGGEMSMGGGANVGILNNLPQ